MPELMNKDTPTLASQIPDIQDRVLLSGEKVKYSPKSGVIYKIDPSNPDKLGPVHSDEIGKPGGQPERTILSPIDNSPKDLGASLLSSQSGAAGGATPTPTPTPTTKFSDMEMPAAKSNAKLAPIKKKKKTVENSIEDTQAENPYSSSFTP